MNALLWFLAGLVVLPIGAGIWAVWAYLYGRVGVWFTRPVDMDAKTIAWRRSLIVGLTLELLDATHVRAVRLPFNRLFVIRSNPRMEYDFVSQEWVVIGGDFQNAEDLIGKALDQLGYELPVDAT